MLSQIQDNKPVVWIKWKNKDPSICPLPRSGHTLTMCSDKFYCFAGTVNSLSDPNIKKVGPSNEMWQLEVNQKQLFWWTKLPVKGDIPSPRSNHTATVVKNKDGRDSYIFYFGGMGDKGKLDDCYMFETSDLLFTKIEPKGLIPSPRANHTACYYNSKVYIFGGNGGRAYENSVFKDFWSFDCEAKTWEEIIYDARGSFPEQRTGQTMFVYDKSIYVYGGWNTIQGFFTSIKYDFERNEFVSTNMQDETFAVWNHCGLEVEAGPGWKYFSFGGSSKIFDETKLRERADFTNRIYVCDMETENHEIVRLEDTKVLPESREDATMVYYHYNKNLILFGGWNNEWFNDVYGICVSSIVGPSYSVKSLEPNMGKISGNQEIHLFGSKLSAGNINIYFILGNKYIPVSTAHFISESEISFLTPHFDLGAKDYQPKDVEVRIKIDNEELSTNPIKFTFYYDTIPDKSIFFGPGCIDGVTPNVPTSFIIRARNENNENRTSGRDLFEASVVSTDLVSIPLEIEDLNNGTYRVTFTVPQEDKYRISVKLKDDKQTVDIRESPITVNFNGTEPANNEFGGVYMINQFLKMNVEYLENEMKKLIDGANTKNKHLDEIQDIIEVKKANAEIIKMSDTFDCKITQLIEYYRTAEFDKKKNIPKEAKEIPIDRILKLEKVLDNLKIIREASANEITPIINDKTVEYQNEIKTFYSTLNSFGSNIKKATYATDYFIGYEKAFEAIEVTQRDLVVNEKKLEEFTNIMKDLGLPEETAGCIKSIETSKNEMRLITGMWNFIKETQELLEGFKSTPWPEINGQDMDERISQGLTKRNNQMRKELGSYTIIMNELQKEINLWKKLIPLITYLKNDYMKDRHWEEIKQELNCADLQVDGSLKIQRFYDMKIQEKAEQIQEITDKASSEEKMGKKLLEIKGNWDSYNYDLKEYTRVTGVQILEINEDQYGSLEENMQQIQSMIRNKYKQHFEDEINKWKVELHEINEVWVALSETQKTWSFLESLFIGSDEIKKELPNETEEFVKIDHEVKEILRNGVSVQNILKFSNSKYPDKSPDKSGEKSLLQWLKDILQRLSICEKALNAFMETKRVDFPRFYFMSSVDLLDVLSNGNNPVMINKHISKIIISMDKLELKEKEGDRPSAVGMHTRTGVEYIPFYGECKLISKVENYLGFILKYMQDSIKGIVKTSINDFSNLEQLPWIEKTPSQVALLTDLIKFVGNCETGITGNSLKNVLNKQLESLRSLIKTVMNQLTEETMAKVMVLIKAETHSRDVIEKLINEKVSRIDDFVWQSQLKAYWETSKDDCHLNVCDAEIWYGYEYLGNGDRLVVTPLTDRIYVTATQALHLKMGCSPAGPAGTGKTETTKDLASAMGKACYVFNCSEQMDYKGMGDIFRGLAASGSWGCFDEFNRLVPEVLSVCSMQFKCVTDALKKNEKSFIMEEKKCQLDATCGVFITMNPGYLGRSELPEGLKALFRPITVVVPDFEMISENCLMAQGFEDAKMLAKKFVVLYALCQDLLSKQMHYDWGLRAIKSVLVVAGAFKRADRDMSELQLLKRALRDFNYPKIVQDDIPIFDGLIGDLFPNVEVARKRDMNFEKKILEACSVVNEKKVGRGAIDEDAQPIFKYTPEDGFILKIVQLKELIEIRHSVFIMGNAGSGKTATWRTLAKAFDIAGIKTETKDLNPKSIASDDLYGKYINIQTRDFKYGILSNIMKNMSTAPDKNQKWIILDGDLDAHWIENMNSVMDDNKVLTLPNNDRIDLLPHMRLFFEIRDLKFASKATVSRAGILYITDDDGYQWRGYIKSWVQQMQFRPKVKEETERLFDRFLKDCFIQLRNSRFIIDQVFQITFVISFCKLLEAYIDKKEACINKDPKKQIKGDEEPYVGYDLLFCFCAIWAMGGILTDKDGVDYRRIFSDWFRTQFKEFHIPTKGTIFDYFILFNQERNDDKIQPKFEEWTKKIPDFEFRPADNIKYVTVPTSETVSVAEMMEKLLEIGHPSLLIGMAGCGKTQICRGMLESNRAKNEKTNSFTFVTVNFNYYSDTYIMQSVLIQNTEKFTQRTFVPKGNPKLMAVFIDDLNMQKLDSCLTQNAIELVRQFIDYKHIYECTKMELMEFMNVQFVASMNPTAGSFNINPRLQRHFWICAIPFPSDDNIRSIYQSFMNGHFKSFNSQIQDLSKGLVAGIVKLHRCVFAKFKKSAVNFHYEFNIRHITGVFQGVLMSSVEKFKDPEKVAKLWVHECERVYGDRLVSVNDLNTFRGELSGEVLKTAFQGKYNIGKYLTEKSEPIIFCRFVNGYLDNVYDMAPKLSDVILKAEQALSEYNDQYTRMDLVLFDDAVKHVCRVTRIISQPSGHANLVGVGGSGKQSLSKLSSFICQYNVYGITISSDYRLNSFKEDLQKMFNITGMSDDAGLLFILTEGQIIDERFMVLVNDLLSSGDIQDLFTIDDKEIIINKSKAACKSATRKDTPQDVWNFFIGRVKKNLHVCLCFSPGENLRNKARKFPSIINSTVIDWFQPWPEDALTKVAEDQLKRDFNDNEDFINAPFFQSVVKFMPTSFSIVGERSKEMFESDRRYTYITPKSFLELLKLFASMYKKKVNVIQDNKLKLEAGLEKLKIAKESISILEGELEIKSVEIGKIKIEAEITNKEAQAKAEIVGKATDEATKEQTRVSGMKADIEQKSKECQDKLSEFKPQMDMCFELAKKIKKEDLDKVRQIKPQPPQKIMNILTAIYIMLAGQVEEKMPIEVDNKCMPKKIAKDDVLKMLLDTKKLIEVFQYFLDVIKLFKYKEKNFDNINSKYPDFFTTDEAEYEKKIKEAKSASQGVEILYMWLYNMNKFFYSAKTVEPMQKNVDEMKIKLAAAEEELAVVQAQVDDLNAQLAIVMAAKQKAENELNEAETEERNCKKKLSLAKRFINALGSSSERWTLNIQEYADQLNVIIGDIMLASAFVSYCGPFPKKYREKIKENFFKYITSKEIPHSETASDPLCILTNDAEKAKWNNQRLPADPVSIENATILTNSERWSLIIDPQLQGIKWIKEKEKENGLTMLRMNTKKLINTIGDCIEDGKTVVMENLDEMIDATLSPIIGRNVFKKKYYKLGNNQHEIHPKFRFIMHTKLSNPHYPPEIQAEACLINFAVTEDGLSDQILAIIVKMERPTLAKNKEKVIQDQNQCKITLMELEEKILTDLNTPGDLLENEPLVERLENSKIVSEKVSVTMKEAKKTEEEINESSNAYSSAAVRASLIFFLFTELYKLHTFYKFSLESFILVIRRAVGDVSNKWRIKLKPDEPVPEPEPPKKEEELPKKVEEPKKEGEAVPEGEPQAQVEGGENKDEEAQKAEEEESKKKEEEEEEEEKEDIMEDSLRIQRVADLVTAITEFSFFYVRRGLFEMHKLIFATLLTFRIQLKDNKINPRELEFLIESKKGEIEEVSSSTREMLKDYQIANVKGLENLEVFVGLLDIISSNNSSERTLWFKWLKDEKAEISEMPKSMSKLTSFQKLLLIKALRPDRITSAITNYIIETMTDKYIEATQFNMADTFKETSNQTPVFFVLFPGIDPTKPVEELGKTMGKTIDEGTFINIPMGQGQEERANHLLEECGKEGKWIMLQNVHLMAKWIKRFENDLERVSQTAHPNFRCFISSEPPGLPTIDIIPEPILQSCIKVSNEAPQDLKANMRRALNNFNQERLESCSKKNEFKAILFGLCFFHSLVIGRKKFGSIGWSTNYNFNEGDLQICADVLNNYLEKYEKVPYEDLRYIYGEIMYGGHITDNWDRRTNNAYLKVLVRPELLNGAALAPNFRSPDPSKFNYDAYQKYVTEKLPIESPILFYLHPNAEISYLTSQGAYLFDSVLDIQGGAHKSSSGASKGNSLNESIKNFSEKLKKNPAFSLKAIREKAGKVPSPYHIVALQECERLNFIYSSCIKSLEELEKGLNGELNITEAMEELSLAIRYNKLPATWATTAGYPSKKPLSFWFEDLMKRYDQLDEWVKELKLPKCVNITLLCNPMSFVTAVKQFTARQEVQALDHLDIMTEVKSFTEDLVKEQPPQGVYIYGMFLQGAKWEDSNPDTPGFLTEMVNKELDPRIPVMHVFAVHMSKKNTVGYYECPVYYTTARGGTYIFTAYLKMESDEADPIRWILAGVALILSTDE